MLYIKENEQIGNEVFTGDEEMCLIKTFTKGTFWGSKYHMKHIF